MNLITPLTIGLVGSLHCIGMCGPIALALPLKGKSNLHRVFGLLLYNFGRIITYGLFGTLFGIMGKSFHLAGIQRQVSVFLGVLIIVGLLVPYILKKQNKLTGLWYKIFGNLYSEMSVLLKNGSLWSLFVIGFLNGFLPCGLVYLAIAGAIAQPEIIDGTLFMVMFGLGTMPAMFAVGWASKYISLGLRNAVKRATPYLVGFFGLLLIFRGLNLGVFMSPKIDAVGAFIQSCF
ncbi:MAG: sulfite exporter TauE/SafE family protein [Bacteroidetes bacterium]|nr:MAG: sulfite exporter TauE/SafE family protein [Bacteroidota bacterium]